MILNSRKRRQIRQAQREGQHVIASLRSKLASDGTGQQEANEQLAKFVALGSANGAGWADVGFMPPVKAQLKKQARAATGGN